MALVSMRNDEMRAVGPGPVGSVHIPSTSMLKRTPQWDSGNEDVVLEQLRHLSSPVSPRQNISHRPERLEI